MKKILPLTLAVLGLLAVRPAEAWNYNPGDLLLVFRNGSSDVEFDLGSVSNYLGLATGTTTNVTGWNPTLVTQTFNGDTNLNTFSSLSGVDVLLVAATAVGSSPSTAWLTGVEPNTTAYTVSPGTWSSSLGSIINNLGSRPLFYNEAATTNANSSATNSYVLPVGLLGSYDYVVTGGKSVAGITYFGGNAPFVVESAPPADLDFWAITPSSSVPKPPDQLVGRFQLSANGVLTYTAGPRPSQIQSVTRTGTVSLLAFTTTLGTHYTVAYTNKLGSPISAWPVDTVTNLGDGNVDTLLHTNSGSTEFYGVIAR